MDKERGAQNYNKIKKDKWKRNIGQFNDYVSSVKVAAEINTLLSRTGHNEPNMSTDDNSENIKNKSFAKGQRKQLIDQDDLVRRNRKNIDYLSNPSNQRNRFRSESPPPKSKRTKNGINGGKIKGCSYCRPEISKNMEKKSQIRNEIMNINKNDILCQ
jgi:hypothetical protein